jgi:hypothetical protein
LLERRREFVLEDELVVLQLGGHSILHQELAQEDLHCQVRVLVAWTDPLTAREGNVGVGMDFADVLWSKSIGFEVHRVITPVCFVRVKHQRREKEESSFGNSVGSLIDWEIQIKVLGIKYSSTY